MDDIDDIDDIHQQFEQLEQINCQVDYLKRQLNDIIAASNDVEQVAEAKRKLVLLNNIIPDSMRIMRKNGK
jgi:GTP1/Obg family GTP-binding protein